MRSSYVKCSEDDNELLAEVCRLLRLEMFTHRALRKTWPEVGLSATATEVTTNFGSGG